MGAMIRRLACWITPEELKATLAREYAEIVQQVKQLNINLQ